MPTSFNLVVVHRQRLVVEAFVGGDGAVGASLEDPLHPGEPNLRALQISEAERVKRTQLKTPPKKTHAQGKEGAGTWP